MKHYQSSLQIIFLTAILIYNAAPAASAPQKSPVSLSETEIAAIKKVSHKHDLTPLIVAIRANNLAAVRYFLRESPEDVNKPNRLGTPPLLEATVTGSVPIAQALIESKANVNQKETSLGLSPLIKAAHEQDAPMAQCLIDAKADTNAETPCGCSVLDFVFFPNRNRVKNSDIIDVLRAAGAKRKTTIRTIQDAISDNPSILPSFIQSGHDINAPITHGSYKCTPFESSVCLNPPSATAAKILIDAGADLTTSYDLCTDCSPIEAVMQSAIYNRLHSKEAAEQECLSIFQKALDAKRIDLATIGNKTLFTAVLLSYIPGTRMLLQKGLTYIPESDTKKDFLDKVREEIANDQKRKQIAVQFFREQTGSEQLGNNFGDIVGEYLDVPTA